MALRYAIMTLRAKTTPKTTNQAAKANKENFCMIPLGNRNNTTPERVENITIKTGYFAGTAIIPLGTVVIMPPFSSLTISVGVHVSPSIDVVIVLTYLE